MAMISFCLDCPEAGGGAAGMSTGLGSSHTLGRPLMPAK